jgi:hypothetical protein
MRSIDKKTKKQLLELIPNHPDFNRMKTFTKAKIITILEQCFEESSLRNDELITEEKLVQILLGNYNEISSQSVVIS